MNFIKQNLVLVICVIVAVAAIMYYSLFMKGPSTGGALLTSTSGNSQTANQQLLTSLSNLKTLKLDNTVFTDPVFVSLTDFGVVIPTQNIGRRNPFMSFGSTPIIQKQNTNTSKSKVVK